MTEFDSYAHDYDAALNRGLAISGETKGYFANGRIRWLTRCLRNLGFHPRTVLDFGCGTGTATPFLIDILKAERVVGVDVSSKSLDVARRTHAALPVEFRLMSECRPTASVDLAFCNGVFHHVAPAHRADTARYITACLRPGGLFALWDNNPWNPGARYIMSRISFDKDAVPVSARQMRAVMGQTGCSIVRTDYLFLFPHFTRCLRLLEPWLTRVPLGAQYQVLGRKLP